MGVEIITRRGSEQMDAAAFRAVRAQYSSTLVDLGTGDGAWPRRFAREHPQLLAVGIDADRGSLREAARMAGRKPARGGAPNALFVAAAAESLPDELSGAADWLTIYFPWSALLALLLRGAPQVSEMLMHTAADRARLSIVLNAEAAPEGFDLPTPESLRRSLADPLDAAGFRITSCDWTSQPPPTTWSGRLVKGSGRQTIGLEAVR